MNKPFSHLLTNALVAATSIFMVNCKNETPPTEAAETPAPAAIAIAKTSFGTTADGQAVDKFTLKNKQGMQVDVITYGGIITTWTAPDKAGNYANVVLGYHLHRQLLSGLKASDRGFKRGRLRVLCFPECPAALLEAAYLSNDKEAARLGTVEYRQQIAEAIADGVAAYSATLAGLRNTSPQVN